MLTNEEKINYTKEYLNQHICSVLAVPIKILFEEDTFIFIIKYKGSICQMKSKSPETIIKGITEGSTKVRERILDQIIQLIQHTMLTHDQLMDVCTGNYDHLCDRMILRPLNYERNKKELFQVPHIRVGDLALVLYLEISNVNTNYFTAKINYSQLKSWNISSAQALTEALTNTCKRYPAMLYSVQELIENLFDTPKNTLPFESEKTADILENGYVLTNPAQLNGATTIFYPGVLEKLARYLSSDFYIAFTSIHESQIHPVGKLSVEQIRYSLTNVNASIDPDDFFSNNVYFYNSSEKSLYLITDHGSTKIWTTPEEV